jgi:hypothetical protein
LPENRPVGVILRSKIIIIAANRAIASYDDIIGIIDRDRLGIIFRSIVYCILPENRAVGIVFYDKIIIITAYKRTSCNDDVIGVIDGDAEGTVPTAVIYCIRPLDIIIISPVIPPFDYSLIKYN